MTSQVDSNEGVTVPLTTKEAWETPPGHVGSGF